MEDQDKSQKEAYEELQEALDELFEEILNGLQSWWDTGKGLVPPSAKRILSKLKEKGFNITKDD